MGKGTHNLIEISCPMCEQNRFIFEQKGIANGDVKLCRKCFLKTQRRTYNPHSTLEAILSNTKQLGDCLEWQGAKNAAGYGYISVYNRMVRVHRYMWELSKGKIPEGKLILHKCDNPQCINIEHLFLGTSKDNTWDAIQKGRFRPGTYGKLAR